MKVKRSLFVVFCLLSLTLLATAEWRHGERVPLWPEGKIPDFQGHQVGAMTDEQWKPGGKWGETDPAFKPEEHRMPYLEWFDAPTSNLTHGCMILVSGGSYQCCCDVGLIKRWRDTFTALGYQTVNLVYRTPRANGAPCHRSGWQDGQRAVRLARRDAMKRGYEPEKIGGIGMAAGDMRAGRAIRERNQLQRCGCGVRPAQETLPHAWFARTHKAPLADELQPA